MGRELRRKQAKKDGKSLERNNIEEKNQIKKLLKIVVLLILIIGLIYIISGLFITKELKWFSKSNSEEQHSKITNSILASEIFKQTDQEYYVYFYDFNDENEEISNVVLGLTNKVYKVDTSSALNSNYVLNDSNTGSKNAKSLEELKVVNSTLIKIVEENITEYYENDEILNLDK